MTRFFYTLMHTLIALSLVLGTQGFAHSDDDSLMSAEDRKFVIGQLAEQLKNGSDLTDPGARLAAMIGAADYFEKVGDREAADAQIKSAAFQLVNSSHFEFVRERDEAEKLLKQVELLGQHDNSPETQAYITRWKREVASRALNENQAVDGNSMGNWNSLVSTLASSKEFEDLFRATLQNTAQSGNITLDQAVALDAFIQSQKIEEIHEKAKRALIEPGCADQIEDSKPKLDPDLLKTYASVAMQLINPSQESLNSIVPMIWYLRTLIGPDDKDAFDKRVAEFWKAYAAKHPQQKAPSQEELDKMYQEQEAKMAFELKQLNFYTHEMNACMRSASVDRQGGCWAVYADSVALLSNQAEQMVHSAGALVMRDDPQDRTRGVGILAGAIDTENKIRKDNANKPENYFVLGMGIDALEQNEFSFAEPLGILARHDPQTALELANRLDDEKARVAAKSAILMHMTETGDEKETVTALEAKVYSNEQNELIEQMEEEYAHPDEQNQDNQGPTSGDDETPTP